jgi:hypothetical protein
METGFPPFAAVHIQADPGLRDAVVRRTFLVGRTLLARLPLLPANRGLIPGIPAGAIQILLTYAKRTRSTRLALVGQAAALRPEAQTSLALQANRAWLIIGQSTRERGKGTLRQRHIAHHLPTARLVTMEQSQQAFFCDAGIKKNDPAHRSCQRRGVGFLAVQLGVVPAIGFGRKV